MGGMVQTRNLALELAAALQARLRDRFGPRLADVRMFGSRARGSAHDESDVDILVLVQNLSRPEKNEVLDAASELGMGAGVTVSALAMSTAEFERLRRLEARIALDIDRDGIAP